LSSSKRMRSEPACGETSPPRRATLPGLRPARTGR
jgi:hypothetical protein